MSKKYISLEKWDDDYNGAAIYSLVDSEGKRYIGQATHLQDRLETHRRQLNKAITNPEGECAEGKKLIDAVKNGMKFKVEILEKIPDDKATVNILRCWEAYYLDCYGGYDNTYNSAAMPSPVWSYEEFNRQIQKSGD